MLKKTIAITVIIVNLCSVNGQTQNGETLTLTYQDALNMVKANNPSLKQAKASISETEELKKAALGYYMPKISLSATAIAMSEDLTLDLTPVRDAITPLYETLGKYGNFSGVPNTDPTTSSVMPTLPDDISTQAVRNGLKEGLSTVQSGEWDKMIQEKRFASLSAGFTLPIYAGGKIRIANKAADIKKQTAIHDMENELGILNIELSQRYFGLILATQALKVRSQVEETMRQHSEDAEKMMNEGLISRAEYLNAKVTHAEALRELNKAELTVKLASQALNNTLAIDENVIIKPLSSLFFNDSIEDVNYFIEKAPEHNALLKKVDQAQKLAHQGYKMEMAELMPEIAAMGTYELANKNLSPYVPDYLVGVGLSWDIFSGGQKLRNLKAAKFKETEVKYLTEKAQNNINLAINNAYQELMVSIEQLEKLNEINEFAEEYFRVRQKAFSEGMATSTEVSQASLALSKVHIEKLQTLYQYDVALAKLLYYAGIPEKLPLYSSITNY